MPTRCVMVADTLSFDVGLHNLAIARVRETAPGGGSGGGHELVQCELVDVWPEKKGVQRKGTIDECVARLVRVLATLDVAHVRHVVCEQQMGHAKRNFAFAYTIHGFFSAKGIPFSFVSSNCKFEVDLDTAPAPAPAPAPAGRYKAHKQRAVDFVLNKLCAGADAAFHVPAAVAAAVETAKKKDDMCDAITQAYWFIKTPPPQKKQQQAAKAKAKAKAKAGRGGGGGGGGGAVKRDCLSATPTLARRRKQQKRLPRVPQPADPPA